MSSEDIPVSSHPPHPGQAAVWGQVLINQSNGIWTATRRCMAGGQVRFEPQWTWPSFTCFSPLPLPVGLCNPKTWDTEATASGCQRQAQKPGKEQYIAVCRSSIQPLFPLPRLFPGAEPTHPCLDKYKHLVALPQPAHSYPRASIWNTLQLCPFYPVTSLSASHLCSHIIFTILYPCYVMNNTTSSACPLHPLSCSHPRLSFSSCF